jgi:hypothetical protein
MTAQSLPHPVRKDAALGRGKSRREPEIAAKPLQPTSCRLPERRGARGGPIAAVDYGQQRESAQQRKAGGAKDDLRPGNGPREPHP